MKRICLFLILLIASVQSFAQDFSNKGKDFWLGYGYHVRFFTNGGGGGAVNEQDMVLYFATENIPGRFTNIKIEVPGLGYVQNITNVAPGTIVESAAIPKGATGNGDARLTTEGLFNTGIHITSDRPVVAYAHIYNRSVSGATLLFPSNTLGKDYYSINFTQNSNEDNSNSFFFVVAADTGTTTVEITPSGATTTHAANVPFTVTLNQGEIYNVMGQLFGGSGTSGVDLTGSRIRSISGSNGAGCKKIAVFSGAGKMQIECGSSSGSSDNLIAQAFPKSAWGKKFLTVPTRNMPNNYFRIGVSNPAAIVRVNGVVQTGIIGSFYYDLPLTNTPQLIESDEPIMVAQYITTRNTCGNTTLSQDGDPEMIYLSPIEQTIDEVILNSTSRFDITQHWINVVIKTVAVPSFTITGNSGSYSFTPHPRDLDYSYAQIRVNAGAHTLKADSGFNAIAYGYGNAETYGYNAGTNLKDLYNFIEPLNPLNITGTNSACACTPFYYTITYPYQPLFLSWDFKGFQANTRIDSPVPDSTYQLNGKQVWRYKLPTPYTYCPAGNYPLSISAGTAGTDGCGNIQVKDDTLFVRNTPTPDFNWVNNGCFTDSVRFNDISVYDDGVYSYIWSWDFGDGNTSTQHNPAHKYAAPGTYTVKYSLITNIGCISTVRQKQVVVTDVPVAKFGYSNPLCLNKAVTFTDTSTVSAPGAIGVWHWNFGDGSTNDATSNAPLTHSYSATGSKTVSLQIETVSGCKSAVLNKTFAINPNPVVDFTMPAKVCLPYDVANFTDASNIADGTEATFRWKWDFGETLSGLSNSSTIKNPSHLYSAAGPFNVKLVVTSASGCVDSTTKNFTNVFAKASGGFTVNPENCFNTATNVGSTSSGQGNTITNWLWDFGDASTGTGQTTSHTYATANIFPIKHWVLTDKGCYSDTVTQNVIVNPLPTANFNFSALACEKNNITITNTSTPGAGNITKWTWNFGNGKPDSVINNGLPFFYRYDTTGNYTVKLSLLTDKGCTTVVPPFSRSIVINPLPKPGFISPEVCLTDASAQFVDTSSIASGSIVSWRWNFGDPGSGSNNIFTGLNAQHRYIAVGFYTATLTATSNNGCIDSVSQTFTVNGSVPEAGFIPQPTYICANDSVTIQDSSDVDFGSVTKVEIYWDNVNNPGVKEVDDLPDSGKIYKHLYPDFQSPLLKNFAIRYLSYSGATCVDERTRIITVHASPKTQFLTVPPVCLDAVNYQLTEASEIGGVPGTGVFTGPGISSTGLFTPSVTGVGTFRIVYTYTSAFGCVDSAANTVTVLAPAKANFGFSKPTCEKNIVTFTDSSSIPAASGTITNWRWVFGDGTPAVNNATAAPFTHSFAVHNNYTVTLTITTSNGCNVFIQKMVAVNPLPKPNFTYPSSVCLPNASVAFTDASTIADGTENTFTYSWRFGDGATSTSVSKNPVHVYTADAVYGVTLIVTSGNGCKDSVTIPIDIIHPQPTAAFTSDSVSICETQTVQFFDNSTGADGTVNKWLWDFDNGNSSTLQTPPSQTYNTAKIYRIELQVENNFGCKNTYPKQFTVFANPVISAGPDRFLLEGGEITIDATAIGNGLKYTWDPATYLNNSHVLKPVLKGIEDDITLELLVVAQGGCWKTDEVFVKLLKIPIIPNTFTPNGDGVNDSWVIKYLDSYPECRIRVFNRDGQAMYESLGYKAPGWDGKYNGKDLPFGTYYYVIEPGSGRGPMTGYVTIIY